MKKRDPKVLPVWVKLMNESMEAWTQRGISTIASSFGRPIIMDAMTTQMCNQGAEKFGFARVLVEMKRLRNAAWYMEKAMLAEAQEAGQILDEEQLAFLADPGIPAGQAQTIIPHNASFQTEDLDTYDSDCDDLSNAQAVLMANISNYGFDIISEVPNSDNYLNDMANQINIPDLTTMRSMVSTEEMRLRSKSPMQPTNMIGVDIAYLLLYVDDIVFIASSTAFLQRIITSLHAEFSMTDLGPLNYFLGVSVTRDTFGMFLSQQKYATEVLERASILTCNPCRTLVDTDSKLSADVQQVCLFMHNPREPYFLALKRILRYVRGTLYYGLQLYSSMTSTLVAYSDADWASCPTTSRSTSGYCIFLRTNLLSWSSKRQFTISRSSAEAEYRGVANVVAETCWLRNLLRELHTPLSTTTLVYCDNVSAVYLSSNPVQHQHTKHIEIDIHFVRDLVSTGRIRVLHVPSHYQKTPKKTVKEQNTCSQNPKPNNKDWNGLMSKRIGLGYGFTKKACFVCGSFSHLIKDCDFHEKRMAKQVELNKQKGKSTGPKEHRQVWNNVKRLNHQNKFVPTIVLTKTGRFLVNAARQKIFSQAASTRTARKVNTVKLKVNEIRPRHNMYKTHSPNRRPFNKTTAPKANFTQHKVNTARDKSDNPHQTLKGKGIIDSGCSRHMTGNKAYLVDYRTLMVAMLLLEPITAEYKANNTAGPKETNNSASTQDDFDSLKAKNGDEKFHEDNDSTTNKEPVEKEDQAFLEELERLKRQKKEENDAAETLRKTFAQNTKDLLLQAGAVRASSTNFVNTASTSVNVAGTPTNQDDLQIPAIEDIYDHSRDRIFTSASYDDEGAVADFINIETTVNVYKVVKALYGLHQAPRAWYATLSTFLVQSGYKRGLIDKTLFIKKDKKDIMLMSSMGKLTFFFGLQVKQKEDGIFISQDKYVAEILKKFDFLSVKTTSTPIKTKKPLVKDEEAADVDVHLYRSMIDFLMYFTAFRPDIMYLKGQPKLGLWYPRESAFDLEAYSDSDYAGANLDRKCTTGEAGYVAAASYCGHKLCTAGTQVHTARLGLCCSTMFQNGYVA
nr:ribonuclease H-like domain-containing protein [Tanacetum cinerariifolium]